MRGGLAAHGCGWKRVPSVLCLKHAGLGIRSEPAWLTGALFCSAHTCPFCLFFFPPSHPPSPHQLLLEEYANSDPKLALTGVPIVQWPKRDKVGAAKRDRGGCCWRVPRAVWPVTCCAAGAQWCNLCASLGSPWAVRGAQQGTGFSCLCSPVGRAVQRSPAVLVPGAAPAALHSVAVLRGVGVWCWWGGGCWRDLALKLLVC